MTNALPSKFCTICGVEKPLSRFGRKRGNYREECNDCRAYRVRAKRNGLPTPTRAPEPASQTCVTCGQHKPISDFAPTRGGRHLRRCHACEYPLPPAEHVRLCVRCDETKPANEFHKAKGRWPRSWCKECSRQAKAEWQIANAEHANQYAIAYRRTHVAQQMDCNRRREAMKRNAPRVERIDRTLVIARDKGICYLCGGKPIGWQLTLDHVVPLSRGGSHTYDNLRVACRSCNSSKRARIIEPQ